MKKLTLALAGASVAITGLTASPASAADFRGHDRGRVEQVQNRNVYQNRSFTQNRFVSNNRSFSQNRFANNDRFQARQWQRGQRFDSRYAVNYRVIDNPGYYNLRPAPYGYRWVQSGNDAVLIAITSGIIGALIGNAF
jgi:Ni/Co efflux regulator RcnB